MLAPDQSVTPVARRQQCGVDFEGRCTRQPEAGIRQRLLWDHQNLVLRYLVAS